ncbi:MAG: hypothetical protein U9Q82_11805 [Chloroflexota bacterium]|nr:hypothetical protein [Chloroflexota bacterium]
MTGFFFLILTYIIFVISLVILKITESRSKKIAKIIIGVFSTIFFASFVGTFIKGVTSWVVESYSEMGIISTFIRIWSLLTIVAMIVIILFIRKGGWKERGINIPIPYSIFTSALLIAGAYSHLVYPVLPIALGGGNPVPVQLIVENEEVQLIRKAMPFADDVVTEEVFLIDQDSSTYFLLVPLSDGVHGKPIEIRKDYVAGIIHLTEANIPLLRIILPGNTSKSTITPTMQLTPTP